MDWKESWHEGEERRTGSLFGEVKASKVEGMCTSECCSHIFQLVTLSGGKLGPRLPIKYDQLAPFRFGEMKANEVGTNTWVKTWEEKHTRRHNCSKEKTDT